MKILVFDNYDSFTYNLVHLVRKISDAAVEVFRNDQIPLEKVKQYDKIILSPGPGLPGEAGLLLPLIREYAASKSLLGVCLGHQAIGEAFGGKLVNLDTVFHGVATQINVVNREPSSVNKNTTSRITHHASRKDLFKNFPDHFPAGRYHSWIISDEDFPQELEVTARDDNNYIMALQHRDYDVQGVQFHPESVLTPMGENILRNWLKQ